MILKHQRLIDYYFLYRDYSVVRDELSWLESDSCDPKKVEELISSYLPYLPISLFRKCQAALVKGNLISRTLLSIHLRKVLKPYTRFNPWSAWYQTQKLVFKLVLNRITKKRALVRFATGGAVIAFVGPQATGKSTLAGILTKWLGEYFPTQTIHTGKPPSALTTFIPNTFLPLARKLLPSQRSSEYEKSASSKPKKLSLLHIFRFVLLGIDRRGLLSKAHRKARSGGVIFSDRYPSRVSGAIDSRWFTPAQILEEKSWLKRALMRFENRCYEGVPEPNLVIHLQAPVELAIHRDQVRDKPGAKDPDYVQLRHEMSIKPKFENISQTMVSTTKSLDQTVLEIKKFLWKSL